VRETWASDAAKSRVADERAEATSEDRDDDQVLGQIVRGTHWRARPSARFLSSSMSAATQPNLHFNGVESVWSPGGGLCAAGVRARLGWPRDGRHSSDRVGNKEGSIPRRRGERFLIGLVAQLSRADARGRRSVGRPRRPAADSRRQRLLEDLGSTNGTYVNGHASTEPVSLCARRGVRISATPRMTSPPDDAARHA